MAESTLRQRTRSEQQQAATASLNESQQGDSKKKKKTSQLNAPSSIFGIEKWSTRSQIGVFIGIYLALGIATYVATKILDIIAKDVTGLERWRNMVIATSFPLVVGSFYCFVGVAHFVAADLMHDIYPPQGTWGFWYLPGSASFHVTWTGIVEVVGGLVLIGSGLNQLLLPVFGKEDLERPPFSLFQPVSASVLFVLTLAVTPANIYMFTHGVVMGDMAPIGLSVHVIRFWFQVLFLTLLYTVSKYSFFYAWEVMD